MKLFVLDHYLSIWNNNFCRS